MEFIPIHIYPAVSVDSIYTVYLLNFGGGYRFPGESHFMCELDYTLSGRVGATSGDSVYICSEGEAVLHRPNVFHTSWADNGEPFSTFIISFTGDGLEAVPDGKFTLNEKERTLIGQLIRLTPEIFSGYNVTESTRLAATQPMTAISGALCYQEFRSLLELLLISFCRRRDETGKPVPGERSELFTRIVRYMREHICDGIAATELCESFGVSGSYLKALFREFTGGGAIKHYNYLRAQHIISLVSDGVPLRDIAAMMNFPSQNYLSEFFRREIGCPPSDYKPKRSH